MALRSFGKLARLANLQVTVDPTGKSAYVYIPTLSLDDIDRTGNINPWRLQKLMTTARVAAYNIPDKTTGQTFLEAREHTSHLFTFFASAKTEVSKDLYSMLFKDDWPGLGIGIRLGYIGTSSFNTVATLKDHSSGEELARNVNALVFVDKQTRKVAPVPEPWREKFSDFSTGGEKYVASRLKPPNNAYHYEVKVPWSDVDAYKHTHYLAYVRYALDAAMDAITTNHFREFQGDILNYNMKKLEVLFINETLGRDVIDVCAWQDDVDPYLLYFDLRKGDKSVFQCTVGYHEP